MTTRNDEQNHNRPHDDESLLDDAALDRLMDRVDRDGLELLGPGGVLTELTSRIMNRAMDVELTEHLGYERGDPAGNGSGNSRNGTTPKTVITDAGDIPVATPRDRNATFEPKLVAKRQRRMEGFNDLVIGLVARGMTTRDVTAHLADIYDVDISAELVSKITDSVLPQLRAWQDRPLDAIYPIMYLDAIVVKVREDHTVVNRPVYVAMGIDVDGAKHVLGLWLGTGGEGAKYWLGVLTELSNRGINDVLIVCVDGLTGFGDAIETVWPAATVQTCVVHLIRGSIRYCSWKDRKAVAAALKPMYRAVNVDAAAAALDDFEAEWGQRYPAVVRLWESAWAEFVPFLAVDREIRTIICTTNAIESLNSRYRRAVNARGHFPTEQAALKCLYLTTMSLDPTGRGRKRWSNRWKAALNAFEITFDGRLSAGRN